MKKIKSLKNQGVDCVSKKNGFETETVENNTYVWG